MEEKDWNGVTELVKICLENKSKEQSPDWNKRNFYAGILNAIIAFIALIMALCSFSNIPVDNTKQDNYPQQHYVERNY